jgi:hypothetical protein
MLILEDGAIYAVNHIGADIFESFDDGLVDIIDCETRMIYAGEGDWKKPELGEQDPE